MKKLERLGISSIVIEDELEICSKPTSGNLIYHNQEDIVQFG